MQHKHLYAGKYGTEQVGNGKPQVNGNVPRYPLGQGRLKAIVHADGKGYWTQYRQHDKEKGSDGVYHKGSRLKEQFQKFPEPVPDGLLDIVRRPIHIHTAHRGNIFGRPSQFVYLLVERFIRNKVSRFRIAYHRFILQFVLLFPVGVHIESLRFEHIVTPLDNWRHHAVNCTQYKSREEHNAETNHKGTQKRVNVYRFGTGE